MISINSLVVVIDVQGNLAKVVAESELANENIKKMVQGSLELELPIFLTAQAPEKIGHTTEIIRHLLPTITSIPAPPLVSGQTKTSGVAFCDPIRNNFFCVGLRVTFVSTRVQPTCWHLALMFG